MLKYNYQYLVDMYCTYAVHLIIATVFLSILSTREERNIEHNQFSCCSCSVKWHDVSDASFRLCIYSADY